MEDPRALEFKEWLRREAVALGFVQVGFAGCEPFRELADPLRAWAEAHRERLPYFDPEAHLDPARVMADCRTALVGFFPYARPEAVPGSAPGSLKLARYLWGPDYHGLLKTRLGTLLQRAQAQWPGLRGRACVDTTPLLEKRLAVRAGLGWQGRNTLLIAGRAGSFGVLGVLLLDAELPPDPPFQDHRCGTCRACQDACPTGALAPFRHDPARCLSTYTLETELPPPPEAAEALARTRWAAGCDACQEACPWNRAPVSQGDPALWGQPNGLHDLPAEALDVGPSRWRRLTESSALRRVRHRHWRATLERIRRREGPSGA